MGGINIYKEGNYFSRFRVRINVIQGKLDVIGMTRSTPWLTS
jgi:hypothetical protein